jgi:predicted dehydrogenase
VPSDAGLRIGFVGAGAIAWAHGIALSALAREGLADAVLAVVHDRDRARSVRFADRLGLETAESPEAVAGRCDAVYVCTSTAGHLPSVTAVAGAGRALFCEKPLGRSLAESAALAGLAAEAGIAAQAGLVLRTAPVYRELARLCRSGELGRPMVATMRDDQFFPIQGHYASTWRKDREEAGSGTLLEHAIHDVDVVRWCFGEVSCVTGSTANFAGHEGIEDMAAGMLTCESGATVTMASAWHSVLSRPSGRRVEVFFEHGYVTFDDDFTGPITVESEAGCSTYRCDPPSYVDELALPEGRIGLAVRPYVEENRRFVDAVLEGAAPEPSLGEALAAHEVVEAWYRSAASGGSPVVPAAGSRPSG